MSERMLYVRNRLGLHVLAAQRLVDLARRYRAQISLFCNGQQTDAKNILGVLTLAASLGSAIVVRASGQDAPAAVRALELLVESGFGEGSGLQAMN